MGVVCGSQEVNGVIAGLFCRYLCGWSPWRRLLKEIAVTPSSCTVKKGTHSYGRFPGSQTFSSVGYLHELAVRWAASVGHTPSKPKAGGNVISSVDAMSRFLRMRESKLVTVCTGAAINKEAPEALGRHGANLLVLNPRLAPEQYYKDTPVDYCR